MNRTPLTTTPPKPFRTFHPPDLPPEQWCDLRIAYENSHSLKQVAEQYLCDPRTIRRCILLNKSSEEFGHQYAPTKLAPYHKAIDRLCRQVPAGTGLCALSRQITDALREQGYQGSERTVRNYIRNKTFSQISIAKDKEKNP